jgi:hypothetical protein
MLEAFMVLKLSLGRASVPASEPSIGKVSLQLLLGHGFAFGDGPQFFCPTRRGYNPLSV